MDELNKKILDLVLAEVKRKAFFSGLEVVTEETELRKLQLDSIDYVRILMSVRSKIHPKVKADKLLALRPEASIKDLVLALA